METSAVLTYLLIPPLLIPVVRDMLHSFCVFELRVRPVGDAVRDNGGVRKSALSESPLYSRVWLCTPH